MRPQECDRDIVPGPEEAVLARLVLEHAIEIVVGDVEDASPTVERQVFGLHRELPERPTSEEAPLPPRDEEVASSPEGRHLVHF